MTGLPYADDIPNGSFAGATWDLIKVLFVLALIVGLIVLLIRFLAKRNRGWGMNRSLRSLGGFSLGTNKSMQIVEWNGRIYVLGIGENVTLLESITDDELVASLLAEHETQTERSAATLPEWLQKWSQRRNGQSAGNGATGEFGSQDRPSFEQALENRLRQVAERRQRVEQLLEEKPSEDRSGQR